MTEFLVHVLRVRSSAQSMLKVRTMIWKLAVDWKLV